MPVKRKSHPCGHRGFGTFCHRCAQADALLLAAKTKNGKEKQKLEHEAKRLKAKAGSVGVWTVGEQPPADIT